MTAHAAPGGQPAPHPASTTDDRGNGLNGSAELIRSVVARLQAASVNPAAPEVWDVVRQCHQDLRGVPPPALPELVERCARQRLHSGDRQ